MKDCQGNEIQVGDTVCYIGSGGLVSGRVIETVKRVSLKRRSWMKETQEPKVTDRVVVERKGGWSGNDSVRVNLVQPDNVIRIPT